MLRRMNLGFGEILIVLVVVVLIFGANKIPQLGEAIGKGIRNFKKATREDDAIDVTPRKAEAPHLPQGAPVQGPPAAAPAESKKA